MKWKKLGLIFDPREHCNWVTTHAWVPTPEVLTPNKCRVYFAGRNAENLSQLGAFLIDLNNPDRVFEVTQSPLITLGPLGSFDDSAILPSCIVNLGKNKLLYYVGWMQGKRVPYYAAIGLAVSQDGGKSFKKQGKGPVLARNEIDPFFTASNYILIENGLWRMWYTSNTGWRASNGKAIPRYHIKYAESKDGIHWVRDGQVAIDFAEKGEYAVSRPWVLHKNDLYQMWYSFRGESYRIGYAESKDGIKWDRKDDRVGMSVSDGGFDSEMMEYAAVVQHEIGEFMFYNGNNYGEQGIGLAIKV